MPYKKILLDGDAATLSAVTPTAIDGNAAAAGAGTAASRDDHKHNFLPAVDLDCNLKHLNNLLVEELGALPGTVTQGRIVYLTTDDHPYIGVI